MVAEEHDDTSADDVEPSLLLPQHPLQLPPLLLPLLLHGCQQTRAIRNVVVQRFRCSVVLSLLQMR